jgi:hypothetical protein
MVKKHRVLVDGKNLEEGYFATEVAAPWELWKQQIYSPLTI